MPSTRCSANIGLIMPVLLSLVIMLSMCTALTHSLFLETTQQLPRKCIAELERYSGCPRPNLRHDYEHLNKTCCSIFKGDVFHCQSWTVPNGTTIVFPACLRTQMIDEGNTVELIRNSSNYPKLRITPCSDPFYEPNVRNSHEIVSPNFCSGEKHACRAQEGQTELCKGTTTQDNRCVCDPDHFPAGGRVCANGFNSDSECYCATATPCKSGTVRIMTRGSPVNDSCATVKVVVGDYTCVDETSLLNLTTTTNEGSTRNLYDTTKSVTSDLHNATTKDVRFGDKETIIITVTVLGVTAIAVICVLKKFYPNRLKSLPTCTGTIEMSKPQINEAELGKMTGNCAETCDE